MDSDEEREGVGLTFTQRLYTTATTIDHSRAKRFWLSRLIIGFMVTLSCITILSEPLSLVAIVIKLSGSYGRQAVVLLLCLSLIAVYDVIVSDLMPARFTALWVLKRRYLLFHGMAIVLTALSIVFAIFAPRSPLLWMFYAAYAAFSLVVAWLDLFSRPRT